MEWKLLRQTILPEGAFIMPKKKEKCFFAGKFKGFVLQ